MPLIKPLTESEADLVAMREDVIAVAEATHHLASVMKARNDRFWSQPIERILSALNTDVDTSISIIAANEALGHEVNSSLDQLGFEQFPTRAPINIGRSDVHFDEERFVQVVAAEQDTTPLDQ